MRIKSTRIGIAASTFAFATLFSIGWSSQGGLTTSIDKAEARVGRPLTPVSVAGVARRQNRRAAYGYGAGYGAGVVGAGLGAAAIGTAAAVGAAPYYGTGYYGGAGYYAGGGPYASYSGDPNAAYAAPVQSAPAFGTYCVPGTIVPMLNSDMYLCQ
jgi:hypothetical protein